MKKRILCFLLAFGMLMSFVGCSDNANDPTAPNTSVSTQTNPTEATDPIVPSAPEDGDVIVGKETVWEKEFEEIATHVIKVDKNWKDYVVVGSQKVSSSKMTDISAIDNFYYDKNDSASGLRTLYYVPTLRYSLQTERLFQESSVYMFMDVVCTTLKSDGIQHNAIIEGVKLLTLANYYDDGLNELRKCASNTAQGDVTIGCEFGYIREIVGEATFANSEAQGDGRHLTTCVYSSDNASMILCFTWTDADEVENAVLTSIEWVPTKIQQDLYMQDGIEQFENYN